MMRLALTDITNNTEGVDHPAKKQKLEEERTILNVPVLLASDPVKLCSTSKNQVFYQLL
jgi:hypothetical protein